jgi:hypothetical protein
MEKYEISNEKQRKESVNSVDFSLQETISCKGEELPIQPIQLNERRDSAER